MKEKPLRKSARFISILLSIGCIIFGIMSVLLFAGIMVFVCAKLFSRRYSQKRGKLLLKQVKLLVLDNVYSFSFAFLESLFVSFQPYITPKEYLGVSAKDILLLQTQQLFRYAKQHCMFYYLLYFPYSLYLRWCFHHSLCVPCLPLSCTVFLSFLIMGVSYNKRQMKHYKGDKIWQ